MKKMTSFLLATVLVAALSAFATATPPPEEYVLIDGRYEPVSEQPPGGHCDFLENSFCKYEMVDDQGTDPFVEESNFSPLDTDQAWVR
ncbi:MAG TPA: hypothetical protein VF408_07530 [Sediminibacterium sp.]|jgi:hypothetical protein